jgi:hypothetical protein
MTYDLSTAREMEADRLEQLATRSQDETLDLDKFKPGTFGCHEALHVASILTEEVYDRLAEHPAILQNPEWYRQAKLAGEHLFNLYQMIGAAHLPDVEDQ